MPDTTSSPVATPKGLRRWAMLCVGFCVFLLLAGANVNTQDGGLTVPDWPRMYYEWVPGWDRFWLFMGPAPLRAEVLHRLIAKAMGLLTIALAVWAHFREERRSVRRMCWAALGLVIVQGVWGGLGVIFKLEGPWPLLHSTFAQLYLCLLVAIASMMSPWWHAAEGRERPLDDDALRMMKLSLIATAALFVQLILGAGARHGIFAREIHAVVAMPVTIILVKTVLAGVGDLPRELTVIRDPARLIGYLLGAQVGLGLWSYMIVSADKAAHQLSLMEIAAVNAHLVIGALLLATTFAVVLRTFRTFGLPTDARVAAMNGDGAATHPAIDPTTVAPLESVA